MATNSKPYISLVMAIFVLLAAPELSFAGKSSGGGQNQSHATSGQSAIKSNQGNVPKRKAAAKAAKDKDVDSIREKLEESRKEPKDNAKF